METFGIPIVRIGIAGRVIEIEAETYAEAEEKALDEAGNYDYTEHSSEYKVNNNEKIYDITVTPFYVKEQDHNPVDIEIGCGDETLLELKFEREFDEGSSETEEENDKYFANGAWSTDGLSLEQLQGILKLFGHNYLLEDLKALLIK